MQGRMISYAIGSVSLLHELGTQIASTRTMSQKLQWRDLHLQCASHCAGNSRWVHAMAWSGQKDFGASATVPFLVDGAEAGLLKSHGPLTFLKVCISLCIE